MAELFSAIRNHCRAIIVTALVAIWGFAVTTAFEKGLLDFIPNWAVFWLLCAPLTGLVIVGIFHAESRSRYHLIKKNPIKSTFAFFIFAGVYFFAIWMFYYVTIARPEEKKLAENPNTEWQPPELPKDCKDVVIWFGSQGKIYKMEWLTNYPFAPSGTSVPISNLQESVRTNLPNMPGFSPHLKDVFGRFVVSNYINGKAEDYYPVLPQVVSNRLYVFVKIPLTNYQRIVMSYEMDSVLTNCLPQSPDFWDWNYSRNPKTNVFEIVNENKSPIVQVIYKSPREVLVNGVFFVSHYDIQAAFDGKNPGFFSFPNVTTNIPADSFGIVLTNQFGGIIPTNQPKPGKHEFPIYQFRFGATNLMWSLLVEDVYASFATNQKSIFKYPASIYPGEFSDYYQQMIKDEEASAELADAVLLIVIGGGFLWMCFGWIFFKKSDTKTLDANQ